ncbi:MAG: hypothetical protein LLF76_08095 [Planctomycetaceae bacterium]|nr:hypothetical protein [Planctomycetaceae bacterium]
MGRLDAAIIKQQRRSLLTNLNLLYPTAFQTQTIWRTVCGYDPSYEFANFKRDIFYFRDKGWVRFIDEMLNNATCFEDKVVVLTATGKEIAEQTMTDPALEF